MQRLNAHSALSAHVFPNCRAGKRKEGSGKPPERAPSERHRERTVVNLGRRLGRADTVVRGQPPERQAKTQTSADRRLGPSKLLV